MKAGLLEAQNALAFKEGGIPDTNTIHDVQTIVDGSMRSAPSAMPADRYGGSESGSARRALSPTPTVSDTHMLSSISTDAEVASQNCSAICTDDAKAAPAKSQRHLGAAGVSSPVLCTDECNVEDAADPYGVVESGCVVNGSTHSLTSVSACDIKASHITGSFEQHTYEEATTTSDADIHTSSSAASTSQGGQIQPTSPRPASYIRGMFRYKNIEIFFDDCSLDAKMRPLSLEESEEVLRSKADLVLDVLLLTAGTDTPFLRKDPNGIAYFAFGKDVFMVDASGS
ncbi:unnamed protein product [Discula destructiva]